MIEKRELEEAKEIENRVLGFISSVEKFIRIKLYMVSNGGQNQDNPNFAYYSDLMN